MADSITSMQDIFRQHSLDTLIANRQQQAEQQKQQQGDPMQAYRMYQQYAANAAAPTSAGTAPEFAATTPGVAAGPEAAITTTGGAAAPAAGAAPASGAGAGGMGAAGTAGFAALWAAAVAGMLKYHQKTVNDNKSYRKDNTASKMAHEGYMKDPNVEGHWMKDPNFDPSNAPALEKKTKKSVGNKFLSSLKPGEDPVSNYIKKLFK